MGSGLGPGLGALVATMVTPVAAAASVPFFLHLHHRPVHHIGDGQALSLGHLIKLRLVAESPLHAQSAQGFAQVQLALAFKTGQPDFYIMPPHIIFNLGEHSPQIFFQSGQTVHLFGQNHQHIKAAALVGQLEGLYAFILKVPEIIMPVHQLDLSLLAVQEPEGAGSW